jgi:hypothetical protein
MFAIFCLTYSRLVRNVQLVFGSLESDAFKLLPSNWSKVQLPSSGSVHHNQPTKTLIMKTKFCAKCNTTYLLISKNYYVQKNMAITGKPCLINSKRGYASVNEFCRLCCRLWRLQEKKNSYCYWREEVPVTKLVLWKGGLWLDGSLRARLRTVWIVLDGGLGAQAENTFYMHPWLEKKGRCLLKYTTELEKNHGRSLVRAIK